jgi:hypothetical protein
MHQMMQNFGTQSKMTSRILLATDPEAVPILRNMELEREALIEVVRTADRERSFCTGNDIRGFDLITVHAKAARALRDIFCGERWIKDEIDNQAGIRNPSLGLRVIPCNFDENAGNHIVEPTNKVIKGEASRTKTRCNATGWLPGLPDIPPQEGEEVVTWVLGIFSQQNEPLRAELSLPVSFIGGRYIRFNPRIVLLTGSEDETDQAGKRPRPDREGPVEIVDIAVKRR